MNTNTMELSMNEMELVNGGSLMDSLERIGDFIVIKGVGNDAALGQPTTGIALLVFAAIEATYKEITR